MIRPRPILSLCAAFLMLLVVLPSISRAASAPEFSRALGGVQHKLEAAAKASRHGETLSGETPHAYAARVLKPITVLSVTGQGSVRLNHGRLIADLLKADTAPIKQRAAQYDSIVLRLKTLRSDMRGMRPGDIGGGDDPPSPYVEVSRILAHPEFQSDPLPASSPLELGWDRFMKWLSGLFPQHQRGPSGNISPAAIRALVYSLGAVLFGLLVYLIVQFIRSRTHNVVQRDRELAEEAMVEARDTDSLIDAAEARANEGDFRGAFRLVYLATLVAMDTDGILRFDRSRTNWEYLRALRDAGRGDLYHAMLPLTRDFDRLWYGYAIAGVRDYRQALDQYQRLRGAKAPAAALRA